MIPKLTLSIAIVMGVGWSGATALLQTANDAEVVLRQLVTAIYSRDVQAYNSITIEHPLRSRLITGGTANTEGLRRLKEDPESLQIRQLRPPLHRGKPVEGGTIPTGATGLYV